MNTMNIASDGFNGHHGSFRPGRPDGVENLVKTLPVPFSDVEMNCLARMAEIESEQAGERYRQEQKFALEAARADKKRIAVLLEGNRRLCEETKKLLGPAWLDALKSFTALFSLLGFTACLVAEFVLTWATLPYILDVDRNSFAGIMLALAPTVATAILKVIFEITVWNVWETARAHRSIRIRILGWLLIVAFLLSVGALTVYMVSVIAPAREEVVKILQEPDPSADQEAQQVDWEKIHRAVFWVSICAAVDGAVFYLIALKDLNIFIHMLRLRSLRTQRRKLLKEMSDAEAQVKTLEEAWEQIAERTGRVIGHCRERLLLVVEQARRRPHQQRPFRERVDESYAAGFTN
jgi:hypothetical protein